jgi:hypothetical protein
MNDPKPPRLVAYIDEAGDPGNKFGKGSSQFLAMGAVVMALSDEASILQLFDEARTELGKTKGFRKFSENTDKDNYVLTKGMATKPLRIIQVALHKPSLAGSHIRSNPQKEYQYLVKIALERISWLVRDAARGGRPEDHACQLIFSTQRSYPYKDLCDYLNKLRGGREKYNCSIEWPFLHPHVRDRKHANEQGIHLADIAASAFHRALEPKLLGMTDDRFTRNLARCLYRRNGRCYGLKLFPPKVIRQMEEAGELGFLKLIV